jgi:hypothetical protein
MLWDSIQYSEPDTHTIEQRHDVEIFPVEYHISPIELRIPPPGVCQQQQFGLWFIAREAFPNGSSYTS